MSAPYAPPVPYDLAELDRLERELAAARRERARAATALTKVWAKIDAGHYYGNALAADHAQTTARANQAAAAVEERRAYDAWRAEWRRVGSPINRSTPKGA